MAGPVWAAGGRGRDRGCDKPGDLDELGVGDGEGSL